MPVWLAWVGAALYATRFDTDDLVGNHRENLDRYQQAAVNIHDAFGGSVTGFACSYAGLRTILLLEYGLAGANVPEARPLTNRYVLGFGVSAALWVASLALPEPWRFGIWAVAMVIDIGTPLSVRRMHTVLAPSAKHLPERFGLFVIIVLGESIVGVASGIASEDTVFASGIAAALGLLIAMGFWWFYFDDYDELTVQGVQQTSGILLPDLDL